MSHALSVSSLDLLTVGFGNVKFEYVIYFYQMCYHSAISAQTLRKWVRVPETACGGSLLCGSSDFLLQETKNHTGDFL